MASRLVWCGVHHMAEMTLRFRGRYLVLVVPGCRLMRLSDEGWCVVDLASRHQLFFISGAVLLD